MARGDWVGTLLRRWLLVVAVALIALGAGTTAALFGPVGYTAEAGVLVLPPAAVGSGDARTNPVASLDDATVQLASTLAYVGQSPQLIDLVSHQAGGATVVVDNTSAGTTQATPFIRITASAATAGNATDAAGTVVEQLRTRLRSLQSDSNLRDDQLSTLSVVVEPSVGQRKAVDLLKLGAIGFVLVFVIGITAILAAERLRGRGAKR